MRDLITSPLILQNNWQNTNIRHKRNENRNGSIKKLQFILTDGPWLLSWWCGGSAVGRSWVAGGGDEGGTEMEMKVVLHVVAAVEDGGVMLVMASVEEMEDKSGGVVA
ncbi:hypothetical protein Tco_0810310 [Tanacetum coccineum]